MRHYFACWSSCLDFRVDFKGTKLTFNSYPTAEANLIRVNNDGKFLTSSFTASIRDMAGFLVCMISATSSCVILRLMRAFFNFIERSICSLVVSYRARASGSSNTSRRNPGTSDKENHPIFKQVPQIGIANLLQFTQKDCNFMKTFTHIKPYDAKGKLDFTAIMACIIANATNLGIYKMAQSSDLAYHRMYTQNSSKYFGVNRGVVAYTLCANHIPVNSKIISANQHESHFLFDILYNITSAIDINWLSGDGHSINQVNFAILYFINKQFAPHFKRINHKAESLCGFTPLKQYKDLLIKPQHQVNKTIMAGNEGSYHETTLR